MPTGKGQLWINCYGAMHEIEVNGTYALDTGHIVAFEDTLDYQIKGSGGTEVDVAIRRGTDDALQGPGQALHPNAQRERSGGLDHSAAAGLKRPTAKKEDAMGFKNSSHPAITLIICHLEPGDKVMA